MRLHVTSSELEKPGSPAPKSDEVCNANETKSKDLDILILDRSAWFA
jgi:hypothetical protein